MRERIDALVVLANLFAAGLERVTLVDFSHLCHRLNKELKLSQIEMYQHSIPPRYHTFLVERKRFDDEWFYCRGWYSDPKNNLDKWFSLSQDMTDKTREKITDLVMDNFSSFSQEFSRVFTPAYVEEEFNICFEEADLPIFKRICQEFIQDYRS